MDAIYPWLGDLNKVEGLGRGWSALISLVASVLCGGFVGMERERRDKPAGMRTVLLLTLGSTIFTLVSILIASGKEMADPARLASQIVPGIGFLGAGAIIQARGTVIGLTTGATIWACAAVGVTLGTGYVAAGLGFTLMILLTLTVLQRLELYLVGRCRRRDYSVRYRRARGKTRIRLQSILDRYGISDEHVSDREEGDEEGCLVVRACVVHRHHRAVLRELADSTNVVSIEAGPERCPAQ